VVNTVVFLWISAAAGNTTNGFADRSWPAGASLAYVSAEPDREALSTLRDYGGTRGLSFRPLTASVPGRPLGLPGYEPAVVDAIEAELEQARTALSALEEASASARLSRVESQLLAHPHLPQAPFLMGECLALQAQGGREQNPSLAGALEERRAALEGPRAAAFGATPATSSPAIARVELDVMGLGPEDELELDGAARADARHVSLLPGLHHARVWRRGRPIFAAFLEVVAQQRTLALAAPPLIACGPEDLEGATAESPPAIACARWAKVRDEKPGIGVALCEHQRCSAFEHWERRPASPFTPIAVDRRTGLPGWASFTIAGAAALLTTGLVLWQAGAFEHGRPNAATWEYSGLNPQGLHF
jgi:hypothetical protein